MKKIQFLIPLMFFFACNQGDQKQNSIEEKQPEQKFFSINIRSSLKSKEKLYLSSIANEIKYIPLQTNPLCLLSKISKVEVTDNYIFILDKKMGYFKFDKEGDFIQKIGEKGNGPGEYNLIFHSTILEDSNEILLYCYPSGLINVYNLESGDYKRNLRLKYETSGFIEFPKGYITKFIPQDRKYPAPYEITICDPNGNIIDSIPESRLPLCKSSAMGATIYYKNRNSLFYMYGFHDTLYMITENAKKQPYLGLGLENSISTTELEIENLPGVIQHPDFIQVDNIIEDEDFFFISIQKGVGVYIEIDKHHFIYNKDTKQLTYTSELVNNIDSGLPFWPEYNLNGKLVDIYEPYEIFEYLESNDVESLKSEELIRIADKLREDDNPILIIANLK